MKIIYLAAGHALLRNNDTTYNDLLIKRDLQCDMMSVDLTKYDILIASPPCNYYSRANYRRETSEYSQKTKHLLPDIIKKFISTGKPFIVENVINKTLMREIIDNLPPTVKYIEHGRHCYFTNVLRLNISMVPQVKDNIQNKSTKNRQGGDNVNNVFNHFVWHMKVVFDYINSLQITAKDKVR